jgi:hypothetical protein
MLYLGLMTPFHFSFQGVLRQWWFGTDLIPFYSIEEDVTSCLSIALKRMFSIPSCMSKLPFPHVQNIYNLFMLCFFILVQKQLVQGCCFDIYLVPVCFVGQLICAPFRFRKLMCLKFDPNFYKNLMVELILTFEKCSYIGLLIQYSTLDSYFGSVFSILFNTL